MFHIKVSQIVDKLKYPPMIKGILSQLHATLLTEEFKHYTGTHQCKEEIRRKLNTLSYIVLSQDAFPNDWTPDDPGEHLPYIDEETFEKTLGSLYIYIDDLKWDIPITEEPEIDVIKNENSNNQHTTESHSSKITTNTIINDTPSYTPPSVTDHGKKVRVTDKSDLYLQPPKVPKLDVTKIYAQKYLEGSLYTIYTSLPIIPTKQNEISCTTQINKMTDRDLLNLYPTHIIQTRPACMYNEVEGIELHPILGLLLPIHGYSREEIIDNIIKYPHIHRIMREIDGNIVPFYSNIEIDGKLQPITAIWKSLLESDTIPYRAEFVKEYVVRRYLLERDVKKIEHNYPIYGDFDSYLTLFMPYQQYKQFVKLSDIELAKACVNARVNYKRSRNPILRRILNG